MFRTEIGKSNSAIYIDYGSQILSLGSCFAVNIGQKLSEGKIKCIVNPLGISFNPPSIFNLISKGVLEDYDISDSYTERDGLFYNFKLHSEFRAKSQVEFDSKKEEAFSKLSHAILKSSVIILTFGTAWIYERKSDQELVSNCHKLSAKEFNKRLITVEEIISGFFEMKEHVEKVNPKAEFLLTVSPVRHTRDTLEGNSVSKSILRTACHYLSEMSEDVSYYPAYEIMVDDLRDYRFYEADMIHPNQQGIDYIWDHFRSAYFIQETEDLYQKWSKLQRALSHRPFNPESNSHQKFLKKTLNELEQLKDQIDLKSEIKKLQTQLA